MRFSFPETPAQWQTAYTRDQAHRESGRHVRRSDFFLLMGISLVTTGFLFSLFDRFSMGLPPFAWLVLLIVFAAICSFAALFLLAAQANQFAREFIMAFYNPPEGIDVSKMLQYRLRGVPKLPPPLNMFVKFEYVLVRDGSMTKSGEWPAWMSQNLGGPLLLIVFDGCALYLERGNRFSRVVGPGGAPPFLEWHETIKYVVDLRPKTREGSIKGWTKDGIAVEFIMQIECQIGDPQIPHPGLVYPYDPAAVKLAIERHALRWPDRASNGAPIEFTWLDAAWGQVTGVVPNYIGSRMLDDLFIADRNGGQILSPEAIEQLFNDINKQTRGFGVYVTAFRVCEIRLPAEVEAALRDSWRAEKQSIATIEDGMMKARQIREREEARAKAQQDLLYDILEELGSENSKNLDFAEPLLLSLSRILNESLDDPLMRAYLANESMESLKKLQEMLE